MTKIPHIAIIGAGFSGILLCHHLISLAKKPLQITIIDKNSFARGTAYKTISSVHFLNVKAGNMSAFPDSKDDFLHFAEAENIYLPRKIYGSYLQSIWEKTVQLAKEKNIDLHKLLKEVVAITSKSLTFSDGTSQEADAIVLACGVPDNKFFLPPSKNYIQNIWQSESMAHIPTSSHVVILGSGLTMLDALASLEERKFNGDITVISNDGKLPEVHAQLESNPPKFFASYSPSSARELVHLIRTALKKAKLESFDWRYVIDELRPHTQRIWQSLPPHEKKKLVPLLSLWNRHRHRMPQQYADLVQRFPFKHIAGSVLSVEEGFIIHLENQTIAADTILNCTGPEMRLYKNRSPLIQNLLSSGSLQPDAINLGAAVDENNSLLGTAQGRIFALGQLLFGTKLEITAVPELREDCLKLAKHLASKFEVL